MKKQIVELFSDITSWVNVGGLYRHSDLRVKSIEPFGVNGEMATVEWYRIILEDGSSVDVNGKFVHLLSYPAEDK